MAKILPLEDPPSLSSTEGSDSEELVSSPIAAVPLKTVPQKRKSEGTTSRGVTTKKTKRQGTPPSTRLWSEGDEITLLQRLIDFHADTATNPFDHKQRFHDFIRNEITCEVSQSQLVDKIKKLRTKYIGTLNKKVNRSFAKPHEKECLRLARFIWDSHCTVLLTSKTLQQQQEEEEEEEVFSHGNQVEDEVFSLSDGNSGNVKVVEQGVNDDDEVGPNGTLLFTPTTLLHEGSSRGDKKLTCLSSGDSAKVVEQAVKEVSTPNAQAEISAHIAETAVAQDKSLADAGEEDAAGGSSTKLVESEVLAPAAGDLGTNVVEEDNEELARGVGGSGDKVAEQVDEALAQGLGEKLVEEEAEDLARGSGEKVVEEEAEDLARGSGEKVVEEEAQDLAQGSGEKVVEEEAEDLARGSGDSDPEWFEKSLLVQSLARYGVAEQTIKQRWSTFSEEDKKKVEEDGKSLESKLLQVVSEILQYTSELAAKFAKAT